MGNFSCSFPIINIFQVLINVLIWYKYINVACYFSVSHFIAKSVVTSLDISYKALMCFYVFCLYHSVWYIHSAKFSELSIATRRRPSSPSVNCFRGFLMLWKLQEGFCLGLVACCTKVQLLRQWGLPRKKGVFNATDVLLGEWENLPQIPLSN